MYNIDTYQQIQGQTGGYFVETKDYMDNSKLQMLQEEIARSTKMIQSINDYTGRLKTIANRQKILSLNASIEAARSGEAGVGFAVVAKSMQDLSSQSAVIYNDIETSVAEITQMISSISALFEQEEA